MGTDNASTSDSYPRQNHNVSTDPHVILDGDGKRALEALVPFFDRKGMLGGIHATTRADEHMVANGYRRAVHQIRTPIDKGPLTYTAVVSVINIKWRKNRCSLPQLREHMGEQGAPPLLVARIECVELMADPLCLRSLPQ